MKLKQRCHQSRNGNVKTIELFISRECSAEIARILIDDIDGVGVAIAKGFNLFDVLIDKEHGRVVVSGVLPGVDGEQSATTVEEFRKMLLRIVASSP